MKYGFNIGGIKPLNVSSLKNLEPRDNSPVGHSYLYYAVIKNSSVNLEKNSIF